MKRVIIPLVLGIALAEWGHLAPPTYLLFLLLIILLLAAGLLYWLPRRDGGRWLKSSFILALSLFFIVAGVALHKSATPRCSLTAGRHTLIVRLDKSPQATERSCRVAGEVEQQLCDSVWQPAFGRLMIYLPKDSAALRMNGGDLLKMTVTLREIDDVWLSPTFNYRTYLRRQGILLRCYADARHYTHIPQPPTHLRHRAQQMQRHLVAYLYTSSLSQKHQTTSAALLLGVRDSQLDIVRQQYNRAGVVHLLCVSGLHVGLIAFIIGFCLSPIGNRQWQRLLRGVLQLAGVWAYVFVTGMAPASTRAGIMFSFFIVAHLLRRNYDKVNTLCSAAFLMLPFRPMLLFDMGFQLSFAAMIGLVAIFPHLASLVQMGYDEEEYDCKMQSNVPRIKLIAQSTGKQLWDLVCLTFAAQLAVLPLVLYYFHSFPTYFLIAGVVIVPFAGVILLSALAVVVFHGCPVFADLAAQLLNGLLTMVDAITLRIGALPYSMLTINYFSPLMVILLYVAIWLFARFLKEYCQQRGSQSKDHSLSEP